MLLLKSNKNLDSDNGFNVEEEGASAAKPEKRQHTPTNDT
jgi:hypothetical protein